MYFFQQGRQASCRYLLRGDFDGRKQAQVIQNFFVSQEQSLSAYLKAQGWQLSIEDLWAGILVEPLDESIGPGLLIDIPHFLVDAQRGLLCLDHAFREGAGPMEPSISFASTRSREAFCVLSKDLSAHPLSTQQTLTQSILNELAPLLPDGIRLVQNLDRADSFETGWGNGFATLDLDQQQLSKLAQTDKAIWKRYLLRTSGRLLAEIKMHETPLPAFDRPLLTSVGRIPGPALPLPSLSKAVQALYMFPCRVPQSRFTMTLYSYGPRLFFIVSGNDEMADQRMISQTLLGRGWVLETKGE